ncbi:MAG TPA: hypothetical protein VE987_04835 [Polyangiaceae bacterium]|nr:hypothetical protein [Polyangiaceae bacterium]
MSRRLAPTLANVLASLAVAVLLAGGVGCGKKADDTAVAPTASALTASAADSTTAVWHYVIDPKGVAHVDMPGLNEHIKAEATGAAGALDIVGSDLAQSRGLVRVDLSTLTTHTFGDENKDATQTKHARTWLEAVVDGKTNEGMRWAEFAIRSVDGLSATDVKAVAPTKVGGDDLRTVTMTVHGDLLVHGHKLPKDDVVQVSFRYPAGAPAGSKPTRIDVESKQPMRVILKEHDVSPRDPAGQLLAWTANLVSKVAETADVTVALSAMPGSP